MGISRDIRLLPAGSGTALFNLWTLVSRRCFFLALIILRGRLPRTRLRRPLPRVLLLLAGFVALNLVPLYLRLAIPDMRDVGSWGYDQRNYVFTTAGLLDEGLLPGMPHSKTPWGLFAPYWEYLDGQSASAWLRQALGTRLVLRRSAAAI